MKALNKTIVNAISVWLFTAGSAFAETEQAPLDFNYNNFNYNIGSEIDTVVAPNDVDIELVSRICADDPDKHTCLGEGLAKAVE